MGYTNDSFAAVLELERQRLGERRNSRYYDPEGGYPSWENAGRDIGDEIDDAYDNWNEERLL